MSPKKKAVIHNRVRVLRAERNMSRAQLAELIGVNPQTVGALERGDHSPSLDLAFRICEIFSLPVEAVFSRTPFGPMSTEIYRSADTADDTPPADTPPTPGKDSP
ncbi:helix-turn-helix transcriptional regulator [Corynebacterium variabile]|uniref:helix-turn-helix transcriptional regulator n=1 Tax=Corynebacterium variabile TaxID=1727 RepID=UPI003F8F1CFE